MYDTSAHEPDKAGRSDAYPSSFVVEPERRRRTGSQTTRSSSASKLDLMTSIVRSTSDRVSIVGLGPSPARRLRPATERVEGIVEGAGVDGASARESVGRRVLERRSDVRNPEWPL